MDKKKIWHISDTHSHEAMLTEPDGIDIIIHSGDFSNYYDVYKNEVEAKAFLIWYGSLKAKTKILIAGNHDAFAFKHKKELKEICAHYNILYLENEEVTIDGIKIFGSPLTPTFGNWYFNKDRSKLDRVWQGIADNTDIIVVHGPPKGILDIAFKRDGSIERCGCSALMKRVLNVKPKLVLFGHIHNNSDVINAGTRTIPGLNTIFSNGSVVTDNKFGKTTSNGQILTI